MKYTPGYVPIFAGVITTFLRDSAEVFTYIRQGYFSSLVLAKSLPGSLLRTWFNFNPNMDK